MYHENTPAPGADVGADIFFSQEASLSGRWAAPHPFHGRTHPAPSGPTDRRMKKPNDQPVAVKCHNCGLTVQIPPGGRRLCGCGTWLSGDKPPEVVELEPALEPTAPAAYPRIEGDLAAIERLNDG